MATFAAVTHPLGSGMDDINPSYQNIAHNWTNITEGALPQNDDLNHDFNPFIITKNLELFQLKAPIRFPKIDCIRSKPQVLLSQKWKRLGTYSHD